VNCLEFRRLRLSDPYTNSAELYSHKSECETCRKFDEDNLQFDKNLYQALKVNVPDGLAAKVLLNQSLQPEPRMSARWSWMSIAASFLLAGMFTLYQVSTTASIDEALVDHIKEEQHVVFARSTLLEDAQIKQVLNSIDLNTDSSFGKVTFAANCLIDGEMVGHFVVEQGNASYTLFVVPGENGGKLVEFESDDWHGIISPHRSGSSLAVISNDPAGGDKEAMLSIVTRVGMAVAPLKV
jgi:hypothetical protein